MIGLIAETVVNSVLSPRPTRLPGFTCVVPTSPLIGDVTRVPGPAQLCSWAGLTPLHRESDTKVHRGRLTKQGNTLVRWAAVEAVQRTRDGILGHARARISDRRGNNIGKVATARKLLTLVYYGLRDGHIRCLAQAG